MVTSEGRLRPLDFEGACPIGQPDPVLWSTPAFTPPNECAESISRSSLSDDLYSLGTVIYFLLTGKLSETAEPVPIEKLRRNVPSDMRDTVSELLMVVPHQRPSAKIVIERLNQALKNYQRSKPHI